MNTIDIPSLRLYNQSISPARFTKPEEVIRWLGAVQAQDFLGSLWAIGLRMKNAVEMDVEQALEQRTIVRTWPMRGTLHVVPAEDARWMLELLASRAIAGYKKHLEREYGVDEAVLTKSREVFAKALQGGKRLTCPALYQALDMAGISTSQTRGLHILGRLAQEGLVCSDRRQGKQQTFVLVDEWIAHHRRLPRDEALAELAGRYFTSRGPATLQDFSWWSGLTLRDAQSGLEMAKCGLVSEKIEYQTYWFSPEIAEGEMNRPDVLLLPSYDEYLVAYHDRAAVLNPAYLGRKDFYNSFANPTLVIDGQVIGTWKRTIKKDGVEIRLNPFISLNDNQRKAVGMAVGHYGDFLGLPVTMYL